ECGQQQTHSPSPFERVADGSGAPRPACAFAVILAKLAVNLPNAEVTHLYVAGFARRLIFLRIAKYPPVCHHSGPTFMRRIVLLLASLVTSFSVADDWPGWRGADRTGVSNEKGLLKKWPKDGPRQAWKATK